MIEEDFESDKCFMKAYIAREWCDYPSNFRSQYDLDTYLKKQHIPGLYDIDTRELTKVIREYGVMNAKISDTPADDKTIASIKAYKIKDAVKNVTCWKVEEYPSPSPKKKVVLIDYGSKKNIIRQLKIHGCDVISVPYSTTSEEILGMNPDGVMLSNGPGDPKDNGQCIKEIKKLLGVLPIFGICLGHQLLALANGYDTVKMKYGHRGTNQPARDTKTGQVYITTQNHGYAVVADPEDMSFTNANDGTCEGMDYVSQKAFSVQFHPEACAGPKDTNFLFDRFVAMMGGNSDAKR
jgi:carbamoyl-phosphate synthase small subunit